MTDSNDTNSRPISVAELLAKNGTIGAPPAGGRRRRRRGNSDSVTVAELTGEIPIITDSGRIPTQAPPEPEHVEEAPEPLAEPIEEHFEEPVEEPQADEVEPDPDVEPAEPEPELTEAELDYQAHLEQRDVEPDPIDLAPPPRRSQTATTAGFATKSGGAEQMSPDPVVDDDEILDLAPDVDFNEVLDKHASDDEGAVRQQVPSYLRSSSDTLFGGQSVADDLARRGRLPGPEDIDLGDNDARASEKDTAAAPEGSAFVRGVWVVVQCILAVAFGAGLFIAFDQLWRWNTIVALVLSVLVILGLVVGVRVVRKTEDIGSTLIAVAVGALVTLGPLALLQSH
jgi:F0F1-type ATP synthase assembly protein I